MRKYFLIFPLLVFVFFTESFAQLKIGYVDSDAIIKELPDAKDIQQRIDALIQEWRDELRKMENDLKASEDDYEKRKLILSQQKREEIEKEISDLKEQISDYKQKKFGVNGELFQKQEELMKPIQNQIFNAIKSVAEEEELDFVFDRSGDVMFLYAKEEYDITYLVLEFLK